MLVNFSYAQNSLTNVKVIIENLENVNSKFLDYSPTFYDGGIVFVSNQNPGLKYLRRDASNLYDDSDLKYTNSIYESKRAEDGVLGEAYLFAEDITTSYHEGPLTFSRDGNTMIFTRNSFIKTKRGKARDGVTKLKLYMAEKDGDYWLKEREVPGLNSDEYNTCHPTLSADGTTLYFASDRPGGKGGLDIYMSTKGADGSWGTPVALADINTDKSDAFPFVHDNGTLFFASNGYNPEERTDYDIFYTEKRGDNWRFPVNLLPFNTESDDFGFILDPEKQHGYFASNREGGQGEDDIYQYTVDGYLTVNDDLEDNPMADFGAGACDVKLTVTDKATGEIIPDAKVDFLPLDNLTIAKSLVNDGDGNIVELVPIQDKANEYLLRLVFEGDESSTAATDNNGEYAGGVDCREYVFRVSKDGYGPRQVVYSPHGDGEINVMLSRLVNSLNVDGSVADMKTKAGISSASVVVKDETTGETETIPTDNKGNFVFTGKCGHEYTITASKTNYKTSSESITITPEACLKGENVSLGLNLESVFGTGDVIYLPNIYYDFDESSIRQDATDDLDGLASILLRFTNIDIELSSHTDARGTTEYNRQLSQSRAEQAKAYLVSKGVAPGRIVAVGAGESQLKNECTDGVNCTEEQHQLNRRTEVKVTNVNSSVQVRYLNNLPETIDRRN